MRYFTRKWLPTNPPRLYKMAAKMAAYDFWREKHVRMYSCLLPEIDKKNIVHWTMGCLKQRTNLHIGSKYGNIVKIQNKNGEYPTFQNVGGQNTNLETKKYHKSGHTDSSADWGLTLFVV